MIVGRNHAGNIHYTADLIKSAFPLGSGSESAEGWLAAVQSLAGACRAVPFVAVFNCSCRAGVRVSISDRVLIRVYSGGICSKRCGSTVGRSVKNWIRPGFAGTG